MLRILKSGGSRKWIARIPRTIETRRTESNHLPPQSEWIFLSDIVITQNHVPAEILFKEPVILANTVVKEFLTVSYIHVVCKDVDFTKCPQGKFVHLPRRAKAYLVLSTLAVLTA